MEIGQALILTSTLGCLSSLGKMAQAGASPNGGRWVELNGQNVEVVCGRGRIQVNLARPAHPQKKLSQDPQSPLHFWSRGLQSVVPSTPDSLASPVVGRLLLSSYQEARAVQLKPEGDHLVAELMMPEGPFVVALELLVNGRAELSRPLLFEGRAGHV